MTDAERRSPHRPRVLVLGATGYIGRNILSSLERVPDIEVIVGCRDPARLGQRSRKSEIRAGDLRDSSYLSTVFRGVDVVCFAAAWSALHGNAGSSRQHFLEPTLAAMSHAAQAGVERMLFTSAIDVTHVRHSLSRQIRENLDSVWPHLANVIRIEEHLRALAEQGITTAAIRCGYFVGPGSSLGILPVLLPRLRARLVPFIDQGKMRMRLVDGRDVGDAFRVAALSEHLAGFNAFDVAADHPPTFRELLQLLQTEFAYPLPLFSVSYSAAYRFAWFAEQLGRLTRTEPLLTRSIVFLSEPASVDTGPLRELGFQPQHDWRESVRAQVQAIQSQHIRSRLIDATPQPLLPSTSSQQ